MDFDLHVKQAIDHARGALRAGQKVDAATLLAALCGSPAVASAVPGVVRTLGLKPPAPHPRPAAKATLEPALAAVIERLQSAYEEPAAEPHAIGALALLRALLEDEPCRRALVDAGQSEASLERALVLLPPLPLDAETQRFLASYGRLLDEPRPLGPRVASLEAALRQLVLTLGQRRQRSAIVVAPSGTGKTLLVRELAHRLAARDRTILAELWDRRIFALQPHLLRLGVERTGELEERIDDLVKRLLDHPRVVLFIDDLHGLLNHSRPEAYQQLWYEVNAGRIACIACATPVEYRQHVAANETLLRCLAKIRLLPPTARETARILAARRAAVERYYGVGIPARLLDKIVALSDQWLPAGHQPGNAIELLDLAAGECKQAQRRRTRVNEATVTTAVEHRIGGSLGHLKRLTAAQVFAALAAKLRGQDETLRELAEAFVGGLGPLRMQDGPRGVFLFAGPTGVGKTQAARELERVLGGGRDCLVRIDANVLGGSGSDLGPAIAELYGPPPGYKGYDSGKPGLLARVRDLQESVVLFDEIEKAPVGVGDLLLQIMDEGRGQDVDGEPIDFRRSFIVFTTNAGNDVHRIRNPTDRDGAAPTAADVHRALRDCGFSKEFLGRLDQTFVFQPLDATAIREIFSLRLDELKRELRRQGRTLVVPRGLAKRASLAWRAPAGARHVSHRFERDLVRQLNLADKETKPAKLRRVRVALAPKGVKRTRRRVTGDTLVIEIACGAA
jgi:ATP-dependent Clp protease ATP-binding subunit ClpA